MKSLILPLLFATIALAAYPNCQTLQIPVNVSSDNVVFNLPPPESQNDVIKLLQIQIALNGGQNITDTFTDGTAEVDGSYAINCRLCLPQDEDKKKGTEGVLQFLIHGIGFNMDYWYVAPSPIPFYSGTELSSGTFLSTPRTIPTSQPPPTLAARRSPLTVSVSAVPPNPIRPKRFRSPRIFPSSALSLRPSGTDIYPLRRRPSGPRLFTSVIRVGSPLPTCALLSFIGSRIRHYQRIGDAKPLGL